MSRLDIAVSPHPIASRQILSGAAACWFAVALAGQWLFVYYVAVFYGSKLSAQGLAGLADARLRGGYIEGDLIGNLAIVAHLLTAVIIHGAGPLQFVPQIRAAAPALHRWTGRAFLTAAVLAAASGLYMIWIRGAGGDRLGDITTTIDALLILSFAAMALRCAMARNIDVHRRWALRLWLAASAVWFLRIGFFGTSKAAEIIGLDAQLVGGQIFAFWQIGMIALPLAVAELYFFAQRQKRQDVRVAVAGLVFIAAACTAWGSGVVTLNFWLPTVQG